MKRCFLEITYRKEANLVPARGIEIPGASRQFGKEINKQSRDIGRPAQYEKGDVCVGFYGASLWVLIERLVGSVPDPQLEWLRTVMGIET
jgi:hypothetical protein